MSDLELILNSDAKWFEQWLEHYYRQNTLHRLDPDTGESYYGNGMCLSVIGGPTFRTEYNGLVKHEIHACYLEPGPDDPSIEIASPEFSVIEIELFEPAKDRINVKLSIKHPAVLNLYQNLLTGILQNWPEAIPQVEKYTGTKVIPIVEKETTNLEAKKLEPWDLIPDHSWDKAAVEMWQAGNTNLMIGMRVHAAPRTVTNVISKLRKRYPQAGIFTDKQRRKHIIRGDTG
jgi:hypothetical protein